MASVFSKEFVGGMLSDFFTSIIIAIVILLIGFIIGRVAGKLLKKILHEIELDKILRKTGIKLALEDILSHFITYFIYFITIIFALSQIGLSTTILNMVSAAILVLIIIAVLLAVKDFLPNAFAGFFIYRRDLIKPGDRIKINGLQGKVKNISLIETEIETKKGDIIIVPNSNITGKAVIIKRSKRRH